MANSATVGVLRVLLTANAAEFETAMKQASTAAKKWEKDLKSIGQQATAIGSMLTKAITVPMVGLGAGALKLAVDFESSFAGVRKTVEATEPEFAAMAQSFRNLAKEIPVNVNELARLGEAAGALGIPKEEIVDFSRVMALLGVTTNVTSDQAAESIAQIQTQFKAAGKNTENFASALVHLGNNGASTEAQILELAGRLASAGQAAGMSQAEVLGFSAAMANVGINAEAGGSALSRTFNEINAAVAMGGKELEGYARVAKMSATEFAEAFRKDAAGAMEAFLKGLGQVEAEGGNLIVTMNELGITELRQSDTLRRLAMNTDNVSKALKDANQGWTQNSALADEARKRFETTASQLQLLWQRVQDVGMTLGNALLPALKSTITAVDTLLPMADGLARFFAAVPGPVQATALAITGIFVATGPVVWIFGQLMTATATMVGAFKVGGILAWAPGAIRAIGLAAAASAPLLAGVGLAVVGVTSALAIANQAWLLYTERQAQAALAIEQNKSHQLALAAASKVAGRAITDVAEANNILRQHTAELRAEQERLRAAQDGATKSHAAAVPAVETLSGMLKAQQSAVRGLTAEHWREIAAGDRAGLTTKELTEAFNKQFPAVKLSEEAMKAATASLDEQAKKADKAREAADKFRSSITGLTSIMVPFAASVSDAGAALHDLASGTINETAEETERARKETEEWARVNGAVLAPSIKAVGTSLDDANDKTMSFGESMTGFFKNLPGVIQRAFEGGGDIGKSIGSMLGSSIFGADSALVKSMTGGLTKLLGTKLGSAIGSMLPGLGTALGAGLGTLADKLFGKLFGGEHKKVNDLRDQFTSAAGGIHELDKKAQAAGLTLDRFLKAKTVKEYEAAIAELDAAFKQLEANREAAGKLFDDIMAAGSEGIPAAFRPAIEQLISLGLLTDEQAEKLRAMGDGSVINVQKMSSAMEVLNGRVESLGPKFRQAKIDETSKKYVNAIDTLIKGGGDVGGVLFDAKEELSELVVESIKSGTTLPANMKPWIEELARAGLLVDENGNKITDLSQIKYGKEMKTEAEIAEAGWNRIIEAIERLVATINGPLHNSINNLPPVPSGPAGAGGTDGGEGGGDPGFAGGTISRFGRFFHAFPTSGFDTKLHGTEAVITPEQAVPFARSVLNRQMLPGLPSIDLDLSPSKDDWAGRWGDTVSTSTSNQNNNVALVVMQPGETLDPALITREVFKQFKGALAMDTDGMATAVEMVVENYNRTYQHG